MKMYDSTLKRREVSKMHLEKRLKLIQKKFKFLEINYHNWVSIMLMMLLEQLIGLTAVLWASKVTIELLVY